MLLSAGVFASAAIGHEAFPSQGCGRAASGYTPGKKQKRTVTTEGMTRDFYVYLPKSYAKASRPLASQFYFHGQFGSPSQADGLISYAESNGFALVEMQGVMDKQSGGASCGVGWNTGSSVNMTLSKETCTPRANSWSCCYASCEAQGKCSGDKANADCLWSTCLNDDAFAEDALASLGDDLCLDLDAVFASGMSNGGILAHYLAAQNPNQWKGVMPVFGSPLRGYIDVSFALKGTSFLQLHGRSDNVIPYEVRR